MDRKKRPGFCVPGLWNLLALCGVLFSTSRIQADVDPKYYAVMVSADVQSSPARITLNWGGDGNANGYTIYRRNGGSWSQVGSVGGNVNSWTDGDVSNGAAYEYRVAKSANGYTGTGFVYAGINAPLKDTRGKVILLVDNTYSSALQAELQRLQWDLAGDGWTVLRHDVSRNDSVPNIKNILRTDYNSDPSSVKAAFLFGHIPVPYSGAFNPDGHPDHLGAWPADAYYGDMDGSWTDNSVSATGAGKPWNYNVPGDGKFDQSTMPSAVEIAIGRVDFYNMTCYANKSPSRSELDLLRAYLNKDHNFRHRVFTVARRGLVCDNFGNIYGEAFASSGWRNFGAFFGADKVTSVGYGKYFSTLKDQDYLWSYGTGGGSWYTCNGIGSSDDFATTDIKSVFTMFLGSYFGDWDNESNFLRAPLGSGYCLTTSWAGRPHWFYHQMGLGETIGASTIASQNNVYASVFPEVNNYNGLVHVALLGDPTLRMHPVVPVSNLQGSAQGGSLTLSWNGSSDSDIQGYHVYRGAGTSSSFTRLTSSPIQSTSFTDSASPAGAVYMVRAVKLEHSGSGTYYNASQGVFYPEGANTGGGSIPQTPAAPANLSASAASASQINLAWQDKSGNESSFRIDRKTGSDGVWAQVATANSNATSYSNGGLAPGTTYYYRVYALNSSGASMPSNESSATTAVPNAAPAAAAFAGQDANTSGNWTTAYGSEGYNVITSGQSYPGYLRANPVGTTTYQWSDYTTENRALQKAGGSGRVAACWSADDTFSVDLNFIDGGAHKLSIYLLDWDRRNRTEKFEILDAATGAVLDTRTISNFQNGVYLSWNVKGSIRLRVTNVSGNNAVLMGLFFDPATANPGGNTSASTGASKAGGVISGQFQLQITGNIGDRFDIYVSENLVSWTKISSVTLAGPVFNFLDTASQGKAVRFYRATATP